MNIFVLDENPIFAAMAQHDRHVVKMVLESTQLLCGAIQLEPFYKDVYDSLQSHRLSDDLRTESLYKVTHANHPAAKWVREKPTNFMWLAIHLDALLREYHRRFPGKSHACNPYRYLFAVMSVAMAKVGSHERVSFWGEGMMPTQEIMTFATEHSPFVYCGPDAHYHANHSVNDPTICAYRNYYLAEKCAGNRWTNPLYIPAWLQNSMTIHRVDHAAVTKAARTPKAYVPPVSIDSLANPDRVRMPTFGSKNR